MRSNSAIAESVVTHANESRTDNVSPCEPSYIGSIMNCLDFSAPFRRLLIELAAITCALRVHESAYRENTESNEYRLALACGSCGKQDSALVALERLIFAFPQSYTQSLSQSARHIPPYRQAEGPGALHAPSPEAPGSHFSALKSKGSI